MNKGALALKRYWKKNGWQPDEVKYLKKNYKEKSDLEMSKSGPLKGRRHKTIADKRYRLGLRKKAKQIKIWTDKEEQVLLKNWRDYTQRELHENFIPTKTVEQIRNKKMQMNLKKPPVWTNEERETLLEHGAYYFHYDLRAKFFPNKTLSQISSMRKHLGIRRRK